MIDLGTIELKGVKEGIPTLVFSDLQAHNYKQGNSENDRLNNCIDIIDRLFTKASKTGVEVILFAGDLVDKQKAIPTIVNNELIACFKRNFEEFPDIYLLAISGNHDYASKNLLHQEAVTALTGYETAFEKFICLDNKYVTLKSGDCESTIFGIPYYEHSEHFLTRLEEASDIAKDFENTILLQHQTPNGWVDLAADVFVDNKLYNPFRLVLNGHIHEYRVLREDEWSGEGVCVTFISVGNPLPRDLSDADQPKGVLFLFADDFLAGHRFMNTGKKYPSFRIKTEGEELLEGEENDIIIWQPVIEESTVDGVDAEDFNMNLSQVDLLKNYWEMNGEGDEDLWEVGKELIKIYESGK